MRRVIVIAVALAAMLAIASPAHAGKPVKTTTNSASANAFWYSFEEVSRNTYRETVWYVGVYSDDYGTFSDLYRTTTTCRVSGGGQRCTEDFAYGYAEGAAFSMGADLESAHLDGTYVLEVYDGRRHSTGETQTVRAIADWEGTGEVQTSGGSFSYRDEFISIRGSFDDAFRTAEAYATVGGVSLGETYDAYLSSSTSTTVERTR